MQATDIFILHSAYNGVIHIFYRNVSLSLDPAFWSYIMFVIHDF